MSKLEITDECVLPLITRGGKQLMASLRCIHRPQLLQVSDLVKTFLKD